MCDDVEDSKSDDTGTDMSEDENVGAAVKIKSLKVAELRRHLKQCGLPVAGVKKILVGRLEKSVGSDSVPSAGPAKPKRVRVEYAIRRRRLKRKPAPARKEPQAKRQKVQKRTREMPQPGNI
eukprot:521884_1